MLDAISLIVGIVIGSSIYKTPPLIFTMSASPAAGLGLWLLGAGVSFCGALVYAELATAYPRLGGEYNYLTRAYGPLVGFLFGWAQLVIVQTGSIGALAYIAADYAIPLCGLDPAATPWLASVAVVTLTSLNMLGLRSGAWVQNILTLVKLIGLAAVILAGLTAGTHAPLAASATGAAPPGWPLALILILYAYGGWNDAAFVAAEVRDVQRNIPRALFLGLGAIALIYLLINLSYLRALGIDGLRNSQFPAADVLSLWFGPWGQKGMALLVVISALGGVNGLILAVARVHATVGQDHRLFAWLGRYSQRESPVAALVTQGLMTVGIILFVGTEWGRTAINRGLPVIGFAAVPWDQYYGGFDTLFAGSAPVFWLFFVLTGLAYFVLRAIDADRPRPFRTPLFPLVPLVFVGFSSWALYSAANYARPLLPVVVISLGLGLPLYWLTTARDVKPTNKP